MPALPQETSALPPPPPEERRLLIAATSDARLVPPACTCMPDPSLVWWGRTHCPGGSLMVMPCADCQSERSGQRVSLSPTAGHDAPCAACRGSPVGAAVCPGAGNRGLRWPAVSCRLASALLSLCQQADHGLAPSTPSSCGVVFFAAWPQRPPGCQPMGGRLASLLGACFSTRPPACCLG